MRANHTRGIWDLSWLSTLGGVSYRSLVGKTVFIRGRAPAVASAGPVSPTLRVVRLLTSIIHWKCLVGLSRAGIPKEVCSIAWQKGGLACGYSCTPLQGLIFSKSQVLGYGHAWLGRTRVRLDILEFELKT